MSRYGDLEKLKNHFEWIIGLLKGDTRVDFENTNNFIIKVLEGVCKDIDNEEPADVAPIVHAHWVYYKSIGGDICSNCGENRPLFVAKFCPKCGAKMDEKEAE